MPDSDPDKCFVVMPFGKKPLNDGTGGTYDFEKVYNVIMKRAVRQAGLEPVRADETRGSRVIHTDMFKDLRDRSLVLVDLSLNNPNVFYELGVRHVMSSRGTVLMCREGQDLPFDVKLSRTLFYPYDGKCLDWEVAEDVVKKLQAQLEEARKGVDDSPVHLLLDRVLAVEESEPARVSARSSIETRPGIPLGRLASYQEIVAEHWVGRGEKLADLKEKALDSAFGARALGYWCLHPELGERPSPSEQVELAKAVYSFEQYDLANRIYERLESGGELPFEDRLSYASSITEANRDVNAAEEGIRKIEDALKDVEAQPKAQKLVRLARGYHELAGIALWRWILSRTDADLAEAIKKLEAADRHHGEALALGPKYPLGLVALNKLKLLLTLRVRDENPQRADVEGYHRQILDLRPSVSDYDETVSYLRWYQAIVLADTGEAEASSELAMKNVRNDEELLRQGRDPSIGRRQYTSLRRFLEQWAGQWRDPSAVDALSKILKIFQQP